MFQVFFLSVLCNILVGLFLIFETKIDASSFWSSKKKTLLIVFGLLTFVIGVAKLFVIAQPDIVFIGDLFPAIAGMLAGLCLVINYVLEYGKNQLILSPTLSKIFVDWKKVIGFLVLIAGILHFILPQVRFF